MADKLSPWYPPEIKPVYVGFFDCRECGFRHFWNGAHWLSSDGPFSMPYLGRFHWRGLATKPRSKR